MTSKNSPLNCTSIDLEIEAIKRFRDLAPYLDPECRVFRELNGLSTVLCLDFTACPQDLEVNKVDYVIGLGFCWSKSGYPQLGE